MTIDTIVMIMTASAILLVLTVLLILLGKHDDIPSKEDKWPEIKEQDCGKCPYKVEIKR